MRGAAAEAIGPDYDDDYGDYGDHDDEDKFGVDFAWTIYVLAADCHQLDDVLNLVKHEDGLATLLRPCFEDIMNACRFSRLVACQWWRRTLQPCTSNYKDMEAEMKAKTSAWKKLDVIIEDLRTDLDG